MNDSTQWSAPIRVTRFLLNTLFHQALAVVAIYAIWIPVSNYSKIASGLSWHVILCTLAVKDVYVDDLTNASLEPQCTERLIPLATEALMLFASDNVWSQGLEKNTKKYMHGILMGSSTVLMITGIALEIDRGTGVANYPHFTSAHAITAFLLDTFVQINVPVYRGVPIEVQGVNRPLSVIRLSRHTINE
ncbi:eukaryotic cytochrome b561 [Holotrichia oblita]|uniref:Eukaryotic cytochrome b561 n=2 Tax=Holotrichia oblita TaxID=644536 RepID=A0ACB9TM37_HOLOL|nr:eukaryotic cytochrome b561 [Holotrichia oblita]KAI4467822.1 eukaryotic cytochrome b561 [Holotrichia oblita]